MNWLIYPWGNHCKIVQNALFYLFYSIKGTGAIFKSSVLRMLMCLFVRHPHTTWLFYFPRLITKSSCTQAIFLWSVFVATTLLWALTPSSFPGLVTRLLYVHQVRWISIQMQGLPRSFTSCSLSLLIKLKRITSFQIPPEHFTLHLQENSLFSTDGE